MQKYTIKTFFLDSGRSLEENIKNLKSAIGSFRCYDQFCQIHVFSFGCTCFCQKHKPFFGMSVTFQEDSNDRRTKFHLKIDQVIILLSFQNKI